MAIIISIFNNKGGVSKTTTTFSLAWKLARQGKRVLIVDVDPQCNLTGLFLGDVDYKDLTTIYDVIKPRLKNTGLPPIDPKIYSHEKNQNLSILAGDIRLAEVETQLAVAMEASPAFSALAMLPALFQNLYQTLSDSHKFDYVIFDMSPSLGALNKLHFTLSDFYIVPFMPDSFALMAIESLARTIPQWAQWVSFKLSAQEFMNDPDDDDILPTFSPKVPCFLGYVLNRFTMRKQQPTKKFEAAFNDIAQKIDTDLLPVLRCIELKNNYIGSLSRAAAVNRSLESYQLAQISEYNSVGVEMHNQNVPVFEIKFEDRAGIVKEKTRETTERYSKVFDDFAKKVEFLTHSTTEASV